MLTLFSLINKHWKIFAILPLLLVTACAICIYKKDKVVFPFDAARREVSVYTDKKFERGLSIIDAYTENEDSIMLSYTFIDSNKALMPFAGIALMDSLLQDSFNPFKYEKVRIKLHSKERQQGYFMMTFFIGDSSSLDDPSSYIFMQKPFSVFPNKSVYEFSLDDFIYPDWWLRRTDLTFDDLKKRKKDRLWHIFLDMNSNNKYINKNTISLLEVTFFKSYEKELLGGLLSVLGYYILLWCICYISSQHKRLLSQKTKIEMPYKTIEVIDTKLLDLKEIIDTIEECYKDENFSVANLSEKTSLSADRISSLLQEHFNGVTFKQYLNTVRIHAAEQLLRDSSRKVQDIALAVGYANITHFNRMFKKITTYAPTLYRETLQQNSSQT